MESRMREIRTYGLMRGKSHRRQRRGEGLYSTMDLYKNGVLIVMNLVIKLFGVKIDLLGAVL